jgi:hypothetical protein
MSKADDEIRAHLAALKVGWRDVLRLALVTVLAWLERRKL